MQSVFTFLRKLFNWADEPSRKRKASQTFNDFDHILPKKSRNRLSYDMSNALPYIDIADDNDNIEIISEYISPRLRNGTSRISYNQRSSLHSPRNMSRYSNNCETNYRSIPENRIFDTLQPANRSIMNPRRCIQRPISINDMVYELDRQKYNQLLQEFSPVQQRLFHQPARIPEQKIEIIELDKTVAPEPVHSPRSKVFVASLRSRRFSLPNSIPKAQPDLSISHRQLRQPIINITLDNEISSSRKSMSDSTVVKINSLKEKVEKNNVVKDDVMKRISDKYKPLEEIYKEIEETKKRSNTYARSNQLKREAELAEQLARSMRLCEPILDELEEEEDVLLPTLTPEMTREIEMALKPHPSDQVMASNFGLEIRRRDIQTLAKLNWLNDEVINFYMNLLIERGKHDRFPNVHAMNTFFYPKLVQNGHSSLKRWTRKVDIFAQDVVVVPVHLGIHWCMSIIDFRDKTIKYYDSMGGENTKCLLALRKYLEDESMDKKKKPYDTSDWTLESVAKIPQQNNGSDCGVFSCMFAEYICANKRITFSQDNMPYFRLKMVHEILKSKLL